MAVPQLDVFSVQFTHRTHVDLQCFVLIFVYFTIIIIDVVNRKYLYFEFLSNPLSFVHLFISWSYINIFFYVNIIHKELQFVTFKMAAYPHVKGYKIIKNIGNGSTSAVYLAHEKVQILFKNITYFLSYDDPLVKFVFDVLRTPRYLKNYSIFF